MQRLHRLSGAVAVATVIIIHPPSGKAATLDSVSIEKVFNNTFAHSHTTRLVGGALEPFYRAAGPFGATHLIFYRHDYAASALHEIAHWCVAGPARRRCDDYGYWYAPDGRDDVQQREFERVECTPQALEWVFSVAAGLPFRPSADNLAAQLGPSEAFKRAVADRASTLIREGLPSRAARFAGALDPLHHYLHSSHYELRALA